MKRRKSRIPRWEQVIAACCAVYFLAVWALPTFMLPFVNVLPYVHQSDFPTRLLISTIGSFITIGSLYLMDPKRFSSLAKSPDSDRWERAKHLLGVSLGITLFTCSGAYLSPNLFGVFARILPSSEYEQTVEVKSVKFSGSKYKAASLTLLDKGEGKIMYLVLSKRLFDYPRFKEGDLLKLHGQKNFIGIYVTDFKIPDNTPRM